MKPYQEYIGFWSRCHSALDDNGSPTEILTWAWEMEDLIGPDNCRGFVILNKEGLYLSDTDNCWMLSFKDATLLTWGETAVRLTNNKSLEAVRVEMDGMAVAADGEIVGVI